MDESRKDWLWRGCALGDAVACGASAEVLLEKSDPEQGREAWRRACEGGLGTLCFSLGFHVQKEPEEGFDAYTAWVRGCQRGNQASCYQAAMLSMKRGGNPEEEARLLEASCSGVEPLWQGCLEWAARMEKGELSPLTAKDAAQLYERVCEMKIKQGCRQAARLAKARGQDAQASEWLGKSCTLGDLDACVEASELAEAFDKKKQKKWLEEGCQRFRHPPSCEKLKAL
jgi:TPR repeat protein